LKEITAKMYQKKGKYKFFVDMIHASLLSRKKVEPVVYH